MPFPLLGHLAREPCQHVLLVHHEAHWHCRSRQDHCHQVYHIKYKHIGDHTEFPSSMAAVLTTSMSLRIILSVRGSLVHGGSFALSNSTQTGSSRTTHVISTRSGAVPTNISTHAPHTYTLDDMRSKTEADWVDGKSSVNDTEGKGGILEPTHSHEIDGEHPPTNVGVKITIDREIGYDQSPYPHAK